MNKRIKEVADIIQENLKESNIVRFFNENTKEVDTYKTDIYCTNLTDGSIVIDEVVDRGLVREHFSNPKDIDILRVTIEDFTRDLVVDENRVRVTIEQPKVMGFYYSAMYLEKDKITEENKIQYFESNVDSILIKTELYTCNKGLFKEDIKNITNILNTIRNIHTKRANKKQEVRELEISKVKLTFEQDYKERLKTLDK